MDQFYFEEGYLEASYFTVIREAAAAFTVTVSQTAVVDIADTTGYYIPDYIATDYFEAGGQVREADAAFTVTAAQTTIVERITQAGATVNVSATNACTVTRIIESTAAFTAAFAPTLTAEGIKNSTAVLDSVSTMTVDAVANKAANILLAHIANLNAQAAKTAVIDSTMATTISISSAPTKSVVTSATFASTVTFTCLAFNVQFGTASLVSNTSIFTSRYLGSHRPTDIISGTPTYNTGQVKYGSHSLSGNTEITSYNSNNDNVFRPQPPQVSQDWVIEAYIYKTTNNATDIGSGNLWFNLGVTAGNQLFFSLYDSNYTQNSSISIGSGVGLTNDAWNHILVVKKTGRLSIYRNGTRIRTVTSGLPTSYFYHQPNTVRNAFINITASSPTANQNRLDEFSIHVGTTLGFEADNSTITVPTAARVNDPVYTRVLYHFDNNSLDDIGVTQSVSAALSASASLSAQANGNTKSASASLTSTATVSVAAGKLQTASAGLESTVTQSTLAVKTVQAIADVSTSATATVTGFRIKEFVSNQNVLFTPTMTVNAQLAGVALLESSFAQSASAVKTTDVVSEQNTTAAITATITGTIQALADLTVIATQNTAGARTRSTESLLTTAFTHTVLDTLFKGHSADLSVSATVSAEVTKLKIAVVNVTVTAVTVISAEKTTDVTSTHNVSTGVTADNLRVRFADSTQSTQVTVTAVPVLTSDPVIAFTVQALQVTNAVKTADSAIIAVSLFTPSFDVDFITRPQVFFETQSTLSAIIGSIKQATNITSTGLQINTSDPYIDNLTGMPFFGLKVRGNNFTASIWARRESTPSTPQPLWSSNSSDTGGLIFSGTDLMLRFNYDPDEPNAVWTNVVPTDGEWHQYLIRSIVNPVNPTFPVISWQLWIDGVYQGQSSSYFAAGQIDFSNATRAQLGWGTIADLTGGYELNTRRLTGAIAQVWMGFTTDNQFNPELFSNPGFVDFGSTGNLGGLLPTPLIYNRLQTPFTGITGTGLTTATTPLSYSPTVIRATTTTTANAVSLVISNQSVVVTMSAATTYQISPTLALSTSSTFSCQGTQFTGIISNVASTASVTATVSKTTGYVAAFISTANIQTVAGFFENFSSDINSTATLECDFDNIPPTRGEADLFSAFTVTANAQSFTDSTTLSMSAFALVCDATLIPPIRATADLTTTTTLTATIGSIEQFASLVMTTGTMTITAVKTTGIILTVTAQAQLTATVKHFKGIILNLSAFNTQLTVGDIINIDPDLTLTITAESRGLRILPENREITIESETRVNII